MKKSYPIFLAVLFSVFSVTSCSEKETESAVSSIELSETSIEVLASGGMQSVAYQITNPGEGTVEAICPDSWINGFDYSVDGVISFNVDANTGGDRETTVTVMYSDATATFSVSQPDPKKLHADDLVNAWWTAERCTFDMEKTFFYYVNPESLGEFMANPLTGRHAISAGEFASNFANAYNVANPDSEPMTVNDALIFFFLESEDLTTYFNVGFYDNNGEPSIVVEDGMTTPAGGANVIRISGTYTFDETTGTLQVHDTSNTTYTRDVTIHVERSGENLIYYVTKTWWPDYITDYLVYEDEGIGEEMKETDHFGLTLNNYTSTEFYQVFGSLVYTLKYAGAVNAEE